MGGDAVERRRKGQSLLLRQRERRHEAAGSWQSESRFRRPPSARRPDGLAEVKLLHTSDQPCVGHGDETSVCRQPDTRAIEHASWALPGLSWPVARAQWNRAGCGGRNNYSQLMKNGKTKVCRRVRAVFVLRRIKRALFTPFVR